MSKWMALLKERNLSASAKDAPTKPTDPPFVGFVGSFPGQKEKVVVPDAEASQHDAHVSDRTDWEERAALMQHDGGLTREAAEAAARHIILSRRGPHDGY